MLSALKTIEAGIDTVVRRVAFLALAGMIVVITLQIIFRVFFDAISWSEELSRFLLVWTTFLGATLAWYRKRHIAVTFVVESLPGPMRLAGKALTQIIAIAFFGIVVSVGIKYMSMQGFQVSASLRLPMPYVYSIIPATSAVMLFYSLVDLVSLITGGDDPGESKPAVPAPPRSPEGAE